MLLVERLVALDKERRKKSVMLVWELKRYSVYAAAVSETKWFGNNVYEIEDHVILHSGRHNPMECQK